MSERVASSVENGVACWTSVSRSARGLDDGGEVHGEGRTAQAQHLVLRLHLRVRKFRAGLRNELAHDEPACRRVGDQDSPAGEKRRTIDLRAGRIDRPR